MQNHSVGRPGHFAKGQNHLVKEQNGFAGRQNHSDKEQNDSVKAQNRPDKEQNHSDGRQNRLVGRQNGSDKEQNHSEKAQNRYAIAQNPRKQRFSAPVPDPAGPDAALTVVVQHPDIHTLRPAALTPALSRGGEGETHSASAKAGRVRNFHGWGTILPLPPGE
ncbi:MAG: hypothetical protein HY301_06070 [Verrucomicrobia bacterium]|nr:hypothetical protein [Verrucomicrobiota bacterium]